MIGAGVAGLAAPVRLAKLDCEIIHVFEPNSCAGGKVYDPQIAVNILTRIIHGLSL